MIKVKFKIYTSGNQDVFGVYINSGGCGETIYKSINNNIELFEVTFSKWIYWLNISFEEHLQNRRYTFDIDESKIGKNFGMILTERPAPYDSLSYAGGYVFKHPIFEANFVDYYSI